MAVRALVLRTAGTNCDAETQFAWELAGAQAARVHINRFIENPKALAAYQVLTIPGGFSYGDDIAAGKIFANQLVHHLADVVQEFVRTDRLVLGICNGFQVLVKCGLLPGSNDGRPTLLQTATLTNNDCGLFVDRWIRLRTDTDLCPFLKKGEELDLPVAHGEGKFIPGPSVMRQSWGEHSSCRGTACRAPTTTNSHSSPKTDAFRLGAPLEQLEAARQVALRYIPDGKSGAYNPNGSVGDVAGLCDPTGRILGLMPHPERHVLPYHHPQWTRRPKAKYGDGLAVFKRGVAYFK